MTENNAIQTLRSLGYYVHLVPIENMRGLAPSASDKQVHELLSHIFWNDEVIEMIDSQFISEAREMGLETIEDLEQIED